MRLERAADESESQSFREVYLNVTKYHSLEHLAWVYGI